MDNFRDSYFQVDWDLTKKHLRGTFWGKQYDTGRGFAVTIINGGQVVTATNEVLRLKWEKPDQTTGYVNATIVDGKFIVENIDQMFTVQGRVRADFELSVGGESLASVTFYVSVEKAVAVDAIESSSEFTALQEALADVDDVQAQVDAVIANATVDSEVILARGAEPTLGARLDASDAQLADIENVVTEIEDKIRVLPNGIKDEFIVTGDKIEYVQRTGKYTLQEIDVSGLTTTRTNIDTITILINRMTGIIPNVAGVSQSVFEIDGFSPSTISAPTDDAKYAGQYIYSATVSSNVLVLIVEKGKYVDREAAKADLSGLEVTYQLATPIVTELTDLSYVAKQVILLGDKVKTLGIEKTSLTAKAPKAPLSLKLVGETDPDKTGIKHLTTGWHDKALYGISRSKIFRAEQVDKPDTWEMGVDISGATHQVISHLHVSSKGIVLISRQSGENTKVWFMADIYSPPVLRYEFTMTPSTDRFDLFNVTGHSDGVNDYIIACQYGPGFHVRNIYLSKDMGLTWQVINQSEITTVGDVNAHWHTAKFDPYMSRIWAVEGDSTNKAISYSDDLGETWVRLSGGIYQPTLIYPFPKRVVFGRDRGTSCPGIDQWIRSDVPFEQKYITESLNFREDKFAYQNYPSQQISGYGEEIYINFTKRDGIDEQYIYATGDGGESWHCVHSGSVGTGIPNLGNPSGVTADGKIAFSLREYGEGLYSYPMVYADAIEWV